MYCLAKGIAVIKKKKIKTLRLYGYHAKRPNAETENANVWPRHSTSTHFIGRFPHRPCPVRKLKLLFEINLGPNSRCIPIVANRVPKTDVPLADQTVNDKSESG